MTGLKKHQPPLNIEDQIFNLKSLGLKIDDEVRAKEILSEVSYFRLIKGYSLRLKDSNGNYLPNITFEQIYELYCFNKAKTPKMPRKYYKLNEKRESNQKIRNNRIFGIILCLKEITSCEKWSMFVDELDRLINMYPNVNISTMGFPIDWKQLVYNI